MDSTVALDYKEMTTLSLISRQNKGTVLVSTCPISAFCQALGPIAGYRQSSVVLARSDPLKCNSC